MVLAGARSCIARCKVFVAVAVSVCAVLQPGEMHATLHPKLLMACYAA